VVHRGVADYDHLVDAGDVNSGFLAERWYQGVEAIDSHFMQLAEPGLFGAVMYPADDIVAELRLGVHCRFNSATLAIVEAYQLSHYCGGAEIDGNAIRQVCINC
jgi:hypothetical protein